LLVRKNLSVFLVGTDYIKLGSVKHLLEDYGDYCKQNGITLSKSDQRRIKLILEDNRKLHGNKIVRDILANSAHIILPYINSRKFFKQ
jgi:hypothetical protein